jgi:hypothetical protein
MRSRPFILLVLASLPACQDYKLKGGDAEPAPYDTGEPYTPPVDTSSAPDIVVSPAALDLGDVDAYTRISGSVTVSNVGSAVLHIATATSAWDASPDLGGTTLAPGESVPVELATTAGVGEQTASFVVESDDPDSPVVTTPLRYNGIDDPCSWTHWRPDTGCDGGWPGTGSDGEIALTEWAPVTSTLTVAAAGTTLSLAEEGRFAVDDEVFLYDALTGTSAFGHVIGIAPITLMDPVYFPVGSVVQRVPHYTNVTVDGDVEGGRVVFRACGTVTVNGRLGAQGGGWVGGPRTTGIPELGWQGASELGYGGQSTAPNGTSGGGGGASCNVHTDGGGGGHATAGAQGGSDSGYPCVGVAGYGGGTRGDSTLVAMYYGGAGGSGYLDTDATAGSFGGAGGGGGGVVRIVAYAFDGSGVINADGGLGEDGYWIGGASPGGGGGGAGGSLWLTGDVGTTLSAIGAQGGIGSEAGGGPTRGGTGGDGRIRVDGTLAGTATPSAFLGCE